MRYYISKFFSWLASLFAVAPAAYAPPVEEHEKPTQPSEKEDDSELAIYKPKDKLIYQYHNGKEMVKADPMTLYKKIMDVGPELAIHFRVAKSPSKDAKSAHDSLIGEVRKIFGVTSLEDDPENGLPQLETMELLEHFLNFVNRIKKNSRTSQTTSPPTEPTTLEDENPPTSNTSDSGSTDDGSSTEPPPQPHSEPE